MISHRSNLQPRLLSFAGPDRPAPAFSGPGPRPTDEGAPGIPAALAEALDWLEQGVLLVDAAGGVLFASAAARDLVSRASGLSIADGKLRARSPSESAALRRLIAGCALEAGDGRPEAPAPSCRVGDPPLLVLPVPSARTAGAATGIAILFIVDPSRAGLPGADDLRRAFGLTVAEAAVAVEILSGDGLQASSRRLGISPTTARTHLDHIFRKTGARRQAELVRLLLSARHAVRRPPGGSMSSGGERGA